MKKKYILSKKRRIMELKTDTKEYFFLNDILCEKNIYDKLKLSVIMPVYNEENTLLQILEKVKAVQIPKEIVIVDDCSTDSTKKLLREIADKQSSEDHFDNKIRILYHEKNKGKGAAIQTAIDHLKGNAAIIQDADLEYDPDDYYKVLYPIAVDKSDVVYGSRYYGGTYRKIHYFWHTMANKLITNFSNMFTNMNFTDVETCYKAFRTDILKTIHIEQDRFGFEVEITSKIAKMKCRTYEVGISYYGRSYGEGKKITWKDGVQALYLILKYR